MAPANEVRRQPSRWQRFLADNFALVVVASIAGVFASIIAVEPKPPPRPQAVATLSSADRKAIADQVVHAMAKPDAAVTVPDYAAFRDLPNMVKVPVVTNFLSYVVQTDAGARPNEYRHGALEVQGELKRAFFLIHVSRPLARWEQVWLTLQNKGGHLLTSESLPVPPDPRSTTLLYDARSVPHTRHGIEEPPSDWFAMLTPGNRPRLETFFSSSAPATIDVSLFYECIEVEKCKVTYVATQ